MVVYNSFSEHFGRIVFFSICRKWFGRVFFHSLFALFYSTFFYAKFFGLLFHLDATRFAASCNMNMVRNWRCYGGADNDGDYVDVGTDADRAVVPENQANHNGMCRSVWL